MTAEPAKGPAPIDPQPGAAPSPRDTLSDEGAAPFAPAMPSQDRIDSTGDVRTDETARPPVAVAASAPPLLDNPGEVVHAIVSGAVDQVSRVVKPDAAAAVAATFGFPLILTVIVGLFLLIQGRLDHRDPKLRAAPLTSFDNVVGFRYEEDLA